MDGTAKLSLAKRQATLQSRRDDLRLRLAAISQALESHDAKDWEDLALEREDDEVLEAAGHSSQQEMRMIEAALARIAEGDYGFCAQCGAEIAEARLDALPYTPFCQSCAQKLHKQK